MRQIPLANGLAALLVSVALAGCETLVPVVGNCNDFAVEMEFTSAAGTSSYTVGADSVVNGRGFSATSIERAHDYTAIYPDGSRHHPLPVPYADFFGAENFAATCMANRGSVVVPIAPLNAR